MPVPAEEVAEALALGVMLEPEGTRARGAIKTAARAPGAMPAAAAAMLPPVPTSAPTESANA